MSDKDMEYNPAPVDRVKKPKPTELPHAGQKHDLELLERICTLLACSSAEEGMVYAIIDMALRRAVQDETYGCSEAADIRDGAECGTR